MNEENVNTINEFKQNVLSDVNRDIDIYYQVDKVSKALDNLFANCEIANEKPNLDCINFIDLFANFACGLGGSEADYLSTILRDNINFKLVSIADTLKMQIQKDISKFAIYPQEQFEVLDECLKDVEIVGNNHYFLLVENVMGGEDWICKSDAPDSIINEVVNKYNKAFIEHSDEDIANPDNLYHVSIENELKKQGYYFTFASDSWYAFKDYFRDKGKLFVLDTNPQIEIISTKEQIKNSIQPTKTTNKPTPTKDAR